MIHPTAVVSPDARIGDGVSIGPFALVEAGASIGDGCELHGHAVVFAGTDLGAGAVVHSFAVIGGLPQHLKFDPATASGVKVGAKSVLREGVTINRSTRPGGYTVVGASCFLMANAHIAHDCMLGDDVVMANGALLAGHCEVGHGAFLGGNAAVHQFCRIGERVMLGGLSAVTLDVPPFIMVAERDRVAGVNVVGMRRSGCTREAIVEVKTLFRRVYAESNPRAGAARLLAAGEARTDEGRRFLEFFGGGKRGVARPRRRDSEAHDREPTDEDRDNLR